MKRLAYRIVNVFTRERQRLSGNPLCVFENGAELDTASMQALARQFNLSETTFILPSAIADARVRIFTPGYEMPFAGHPTLGTAYVCRDLGLAATEVRLEMMAGVIPVTSSGDRWTLRANKPTWRALSQPLQELAAALNLATADLGEPLWVSTGKEQLLIPLRNEAALRKVRPLVEKLSTFRSVEQQSTAYVFYLNADRVSARFFFPQGTALIEDPATGSAAANLGGWLLAQEKQPISLQISQGEHVQRPSTLFLDVTDQAEIRVGGDVVELGRGEVTLD